MNTTLPRRSKTKWTLGVLVLLLVSLIAVHAAERIHDGFRLSSPAFTAGGNLPAEFTCDGERASPPLEWANVPAGTKSFAVTMHHIPGPGDKHVYLVVYNLPADARGLGKNSRKVGTFGINTVNGQQEYTPPCSKGPGPKKYTFTVYALSDAPQIDKPADAVTMDVLLDAIKERTLATAAIDVTYSRGNAPQGGRPDEPPPHDEPEERGRPPRGGPPEQRAIDALNLSPGEKEKVAPVLREFGQKQQKVRDEMLARLKTILTDEQYRQFETAFVPPPRRDEPSRSN